MIRLDGGLVRLRLRSAATLRKCARLVVRVFKYEVQQSIVCRFAPEGRDVYSLASVSFTQKLRRSAIALPASAKVLLPGFAPDGAISLGLRA